MNTHTQYDPRRDAKVSDIRGIGSAISPPEACKETEVRPSIRQAINDCFGELANTNKQLADLIDSLVPILEIPNQTSPPTKEPTDRPLEQLINLRERINYLGGVIHYVRNAHCL